MYYVGCLPQSLTPCSNHYRVLPSVVQDMCNVFIHVIKSPPLTTAPFHVDEIHPV